MKHPGHMYGGFVPAISERGMTHSDGGSHFIDRTFRKAFSEVGVDHRIATPYHPQTSGQAETSNK
jgi:transposase InsO family protein